VHAVSIPRYSCRWLSVVAFGLAVLALDEVIGKVHASEVALTLALVCGAAAAAAVVVASYRDEIVVRRLVRQLRDPDRRARTLDLLSRRVRTAVASRDGFRIEEALRYAIEPLILAGCWDEVAQLASLATGWNMRPAFLRWLAGVHALAELHRGDAEAAEEALSEVELEGPWLVAVDALRLAIAGEGEKALERLGDPPRRAGLAVMHQRRLAEVHALVSVGRREEARVLLRQMRSDGDQELRSVLDPEGPASGLAASELGPAGGPFRAAS